MADSGFCRERMLPSLNDVVTHAVNFDAAHFRRVTYRIQVDNYYRMAS